MAARFVRGKAEQPPQPGKSAQSTDPAFERDFPALWEYLTLGAWEDGSSRQTSTLMMLCEDGVWKACLNDRACLRSVWVSCATQGGLLAALEAALAGDVVQWRYYSGTKGGRARRS